MTKRYRIELIYLIVILCTLGLRIASSLDFYSYLGIEDTDLAWSLIVQLLIFGLIPFSLYLLFGIKKDDQNIKTVKGDFGFNLVPLGIVIMVILIAICMIVLSSAFSLLWSMFLSAIGFTRVTSSTDYSTVGLLFKEIAISALLPGVFEEFLNRGLLNAGFKKTGYRYVFISALLFSLMHQNIVQTGYTFLDGIVIALVFYYTKSIYMSMLIHFLNNGWVCILGYSLDNPDKLGFIYKAYTYLTSNLLGLGIAIIVIVICGFLIFALFRELRSKAVRKGIVSEMPFNCGEDDRPVRKDPLLILIILIGVVATVYSLVWGLIR